MRAGGSVIVGLTNASMPLRCMTFRTTSRIASRIFMRCVMPADTKSILFSQFCIATARASVPYFALAFSVGQSMTRASPRRSRYCAMW